MNTLTTLLEQAEAERNAALAAFNQTRARRDDARAQAAQLAQYRADYQSRWQAQFQRGAAPDIVRCYQQFNERLELALVQQDHTVAICEAALVRANDTLAAHELRVASVRKLIERRASELRRGVERKEQKATDEHAMRLARQRRAVRSAPTP